MFRLGCNKGDCILEKKKTFEYYSHKDLRTKHCSSTFCFIHSKYTPLNFRIEKKEIIGLLIWNKCKDLLQPGLYIATKWVANVTKFLPMRSYLNTHSPFATEKIFQLVAKQKYYDYHKSLKTTHKSVIGYIWTSLKIMKNNKNLFQENPFPVPISLHIYP